MATLLGYIELLADKTTERHSMHICSHAMVKD